MFKDGFLHQAQYSLASTSIQHTWQWYFKKFKSEDEIVGNVPAFSFFSFS